MKQDVTDARKTPYAVVEGEPVRENNERSIEEIKRSMLLDMALLGVYIPLPLYCVLPGNALMEALKNRNSYPELCAQLFALVAPLALIVYKSVNDMRELTAAREREKKSETES